MLAPRSFGNEYAGHGTTEVPLITQGSKGTMERNEVTRSGITFGNDHAGAGDPTASTLVSSGSSTTMARDDPAKPGVTFGADQPPPDINDLRIADQSTL